MYDIFFYLISKNVRRKQMLFGKVDAIVLLLRKLFFIIY